MRQAGTELHNTGGQLGRWTQEGEAAGGSAACARRAVVVARRAVVADDTALCLTLPGTASGVRCEVHRRRLASRTVCRLGVPGSGVRDPDRVAVVVDGVPDAASASHLNLPLLQGAALDELGGELAVKAEVPAVQGRPGGGARFHPGIPRVAWGLLAEGLPSLRGLAGAKAHFPLARGCRWRYPVTPLRAQLADGSGTGP